MEEKKKLVKNTLIILLGKISTQMLSFLLLPLYTGYLTSEEFGLVDIIITYVSLSVPIFTLQLEMAIFRFIIDYRSDRDKTNEIIFNGLISVIISIILLFILYFVSMNYVNIKYFEIIISLVIASMISSNFMQIARGKGKNIIYSIASAITGIVTVACNVIFIVYLNLGAKGMLLSILLANIAASIYLFFALDIKDSISSKYYSKRTIKEMIKYSIPLIPNSISWWIMNASDRTIISLLLNVSKNGIYAVSNKFPNLLSGFFGIYNLAWSESASVNIETNKNYIVSVTNDIFKLFGALGGVFISILPFIFPVFVNNKFLESYYYIPILVVSSILSMIAAQYGSIYIAKKETSKLSITTITSAIINIIVHLILIKFIGLYAAAVSTAVSYLAVSVYRHFDVKRHIEIIYHNNIIIKMIGLYIMVFIMYYMNNKYLNILSIILSSVVFVLLNYNFVTRILSSVKSKIFRK